MQWGSVWVQPTVTPSPPPPLQVTEISNVKCITRLPKETKRQAVAIVFTDDSARTFTCDSGTGQHLGSQAGGAGWATLVWPGSPRGCHGALQSWRRRSGTRCCRWSAWVLA